MNPMRLSAAAIAFVAGICSAISAFTAWWTVSASGPDTASVSFLPGDSMSGAFSGSTASYTYASQGVGQVGGLYEGVLAVALVAMALSFVAGIIGIVLATSRAHSQSTSRAFLTLTIVVIVVALVIVLLVALGQPGILALNPAGACSGYPGSKTPCNSFWGSVSGNGETVSWAADTGWYLEISSLVLAIAAFVVWRLSRPEAAGGPSETPVVTAPAPTTSEAPPESAVSPPQPAVTTIIYPGSTPAPPPASPPADRYCPSCGAKNSRASAFCEGCGKPLPPRP